MKMPPLSLSNKSIVALIVILVPIFITFLVSDRRNKDQTIKHASQDLTLIAEAHEAQVYLFMEMSKMRASDFASDGFIVGSLQRIAAGDDGSAEDLVSHLTRNKMPLDENIDAILILSKDGRIAASTGLSVDMSRIMVDEMFESMNGAASFTDKGAELTGRPGLMVSAPIVNRVSSESLGTLVNFISFSELSRLLRGELVEKIGAITQGKGLRKTMKVYLVDSRRNAISDGFEGEGVEINREAVNSAPVNACLETNREMTGFYQNYRGTEVLGASMCFPDLKWTLLVEADAEEVFRAVSAMRRDALITAALILCLVAVIYAAYRRHIVIPVRIISDAARDIALGNYDVQIPAGSGDEIGDLSRLFNSMATEISTNTDAYRKSESRLITAQRMAHIGNWEWDIENNRLQWYYEVYRMFGISPHQFESTYEAFLRIVHPDDIEAVRKAMETAISEKKPYSIDHRIIMPSGEEKVVNETAEVVSDSSGKAVRMVGTVQDITRRKNIEEKLRRSSQSQQILNSILELSLSDITLEEELQKVLEMIISISWLGFQSRGSIYIVEKDPEILVLKAHKGIEAIQLESCAKVPFGRCLCGRAASERKTVFADSIDARHDVKYEGISPHGHYCTPIIGGDRVLGVINIYLKEGHKINEEEVGFLEAAAWTLAGVIERKRAQSEIKRLSMAIEQSTNIVFMVNVSGKIEYVNSHFENVTGYSREEAIGQNPSILASGDTPREEYEELWNTILSGRTWRGVFKNRKKDGNIYWGEGLITPIKDEKGNITHFMAVQEDVTGRMQSEERIEYLASYDELTGLLNRTMFMDTVDDWLTAATLVDNKGALLLVDLDNFKFINDTYGHNMGDELLRQATGILNGIMQDDDSRLKPEDACIISRLSADEFAVFLPSRKKDDAVRVAEKIRAELEDLKLGDGQVSTTASVGLVFYPEDGKEVKDLMTRADAALYRAKESGRNRYHIFRPEDRDLEEMHSRLEWKGRIQNALKDSRFIPWFQPILYINSGKISHYEVLARMVDEEGKVLTPASFIGMAEKFGQVGSIDLVMAEKAMQMQAEMGLKGRHLTFSTNLSGKDLIDTDLPDILAKKMAESGADPNHIVFEITETAAVHDLAKAKEFIGKLKGVGSRFSLDDFGVGFTSFVYLREMRVDYIKIDGSFIRRLHEKRDDQIIVKAIVDVAKGMGIKTVAEFVETEDTLKLLKEMGVDFAQGYFIGRPAAVIGSE